MMGFLRAPARRGVAEAKLPPVITTNSPYPPWEGNYGFGFYFAAQLELKAPPLGPGLPTMSIFPPGGRLQFGKMSSKDEPTAFSKPARTACRMMGAAPDDLHLAIRVAAAGRAVGEIDRQARC